jgi:hypothetical protein
MYYAQSQTIDGRYGGGKRESGIYFCAPAAFRELLKRERARYAVGGTRLSHIWLPEPPQI